MSHRIAIFQLPFGGSDGLRILSPYGVDFLRPQDCKQHYRAIILPGSNCTVSDLVYLRESGGLEKIRSHLTNGGIVIGVCGGFQMLGQHLIDPFLKQGRICRTEGLGLLPITTVFGAQMLSSCTTAQLLVGAGRGRAIFGHEHRSGYSTTIPDADIRFVKLGRITGRSFLTVPPKPAKLPGGYDWQPGTEAFDGLVSADRRLWGTYLHGIFNNDAFLCSLLECLS